MAMPQERYVSALTKDTMALVLAGGRGSRLEELTAWRAKPSVYFGGKFRIIDFPLSNCVNSGIRKIGVLTQYKAHSLIRHLINGWSHFKREFGETVEIMPASQRYNENWYLGTADAIYQNIDIIRGINCKYIMILSGDHIYKMDYGPMIAQHVESDAVMTVSCIETPIAEAAGAFGVMTVDEHNTIKEFVEKPASPAPLQDNPEMTLASMGNYVFDREFLLDLVQRDANNPESSHDFGKDIIPALIKNHKVCAYRFRAPNQNEKGYWRDVGTLDSFFEANMEMIATTPALNLYDQSWPIWTYQSQLPSAKFVFDDDEKCGMAVQSVVSAGCIISGATVRRSLLFSNVRIELKSSIEDCVVLPNVNIGKNCRLKKVILDRGCRIPDGMEIGVNHEADREHGFRVTNNGVVLVTRTMLGDSHGYSFED